MRAANAVQKATIVTVRGTGAFVQTAGKASRLVKAGVIEAGSKGLKYNITGLFKLKGSNAFLKISDAASKLRSVRVAYNENKRLRAFSTGAQHFGMAKENLGQIYKYGQKIADLFINRKKAEVEDGSFKGSGVEDIIKRRTSRDMSTSATFDEDGGLTVDIDSFNSLLVSFFAESFGVATSTFQAYFSLRMQEQADMKAFVDKGGALQKIYEGLETMVQNAERAKEQLYQDTEKTRYIKYSFEWDDKTKRETGLDFLFVNGENAKTHKIVPPKTPKASNPKNGLYAEIVVVALGSVEALCNTVMNDNG